MKKVFPFIVFTLLFLLPLFSSAQEVISINDSNTNQNYNYQKILKKQDGTLIKDQDVDGVIVYKKNGVFYKRNYDGYVNVKWFGAKGDGVTDDSKAIQKAIDVIYNINKPVNMSGGWLVGSGVIFFPSGTYKINKSIVLKDNISLFGENKNSVRIDCSVPIAITNVEGKWTSPTKMNQSINIENLFLTGGGIELQGAYRTQIRNVNVFNVASGEAIILRLTVALYLDEVQVFNCQNGISIEGSAGKGPSTTIDMNRVWVMHCSKTGMKVSSIPNELVSSKIRNSIFEYNGKGVVLSGRNEISFSNIHFEQNLGGSLEAYDEASLNLEDIWCDVGNITFFASDKSNKNTSSLKNISAPVVVQSGYKGLLFVDGKVNMQPLPNAGEKVYFVKGNSGNQSQRPIGVEPGFKFYDVSLNKPIWWDGRMWRDANGDNVSLKNKGKSSERPKNGIEIGFQYFDTDLSKPIFWNGNKWVDANGNSI